MKRIAIPQLCPLVGLAYLTVAFNFVAPAQTLGLFEGQNDVGTVLHEGGGAYDSATQTYALSGSGENMWFGTDDFHFVWRKTSGDVSLASDIALLGLEGDPHRKAVLMIRQGLDADAPYADVAVHGDGLTSLQFREQKGSPTHEIESNVSAPKRVRIEKRGDRFYVFIGSDGDLQFSGGSAKVVLQGEFYVGLGVCAHNKLAVQKAAFSHVELGKPSAGAKSYSTIQTLTVASTDSRVSYVSDQPVNSPSWSDDGNSILIERGGKGQQVAVSGGSPSALDGDLPEDYGQERSPDNAYLYMSSNRTATMQIWRSNADGSHQEQLTHDGANDVSPHLSPDGKSIVFLSYPGNLFVLRDGTDLSVEVLSLVDNRVKTVAHIVGGRNSLGAHPWSPDGKRITFVSYQQLQPR